MVPAVSGPYDLGNVVVRAAIFVDPVTAQVKTVSDPIPQILEGVPLRLRSLLVNLDRPNFALNPTNCAPFSTDTVSFGSEGASFSSSGHFQVANCANLSFDPKLGLKLDRVDQAPRPSGPQGGPEDGAGRSEPFEGRGHDAEERAAGQLAHRHGLHAGCSSRPTHAPRDSVYGTATATTPLLDQPLSGNVYLRAGNHKLPDLVADLHGQFDIELAGLIDSAKGAGLRARFENVPDAPVSEFVLEMAGGKKGLLINSRNVCKVDRKAEQKLAAQNGAQITRKAKLQAACGSKASRSHERRHGKAGR